MNKRKKRNGTTRKRRSSLAAGSPTPQGPTGDEILDQYLIGKLLIEMKAVMESAQRLHDTVTKRIDGKRAAVQANTQGLVTPGTGPSPEEGAASRRHQ